MCEKRNHWQTYWGKQKNLANQAQDRKKKPLNSTSVGRH